MMSSTNEQDPFLQVQAYVVLLSRAQFLQPPVLLGLLEPLIVIAGSNLHYLKCGSSQSQLLTICSDVLHQLSQTRPLFTSYLRIRSLSTTVTSPELASARSDLESSLATLAEDLADLFESVKAVEVDPYKYGLEIEEVTRRKRLVEEVGGEIEDMRGELQKQIHSSKTHVLPDPSSFATDDDEAENGDAYGEFEQQQQIRIMNEQDEQLDGVFRTVGNLRQQADDMGRELEEQHEMLEHIDTLADRVGGRLQTGIQQVGWVLRTLGAVVVLGF